MANVLVDETSLQGIADAIRVKNLTQDKYKPGEMPEAIMRIESGMDTGDATATAGDILAGKTAYIADGKAEGTLPIVAHASPTLSQSGATVTASHTQSTGYVAGGTTTAKITLEAYDGSVQVVS